MMTPEKFIRETGLPKSCLDDLRKRNFDKVRGKIKTAFGVSQTERDQWKRYIDRLEHPTLQPSMF